MLQLNKIHCIDAREGLKKLPDESIDCVLTSPPYWSLRDYDVKPTIWDGDSKCKHRFSNYKSQLTHENRQGLMGSTKGNQKFKKKRHGNANAIAGFCTRCNACKGCLGLEPTIELYTKHLCDIFDEIKRVLKKTGTLWINLGDTYSGSWSNYAPNRSEETRRKQIEEGNTWYRRAYTDLIFRPPSSYKQNVKVKSLCLIPHRFVIEMINRGWILRNDIVWRKPNHMPASVKDRFACSWEHVFFFVKSQKYYFDLDAVRVPHKCLNKKQGKNSKVMGVKHSKHRYNPSLTGMRRPLGSGGPNAFYPKGKNPGDYFVIPAETRTLGAIIGERGAVKVPGGAGWVGHPEGGMARIIREKNQRWLSPNGKNPGDCWEIATRPFTGAHFAVYPEKLCDIPIKAGCPKKGLVLDPFAGVGTTCVVAKRFGRQFIGFELN